MDIFPVKKENIRYFEPCLPGGIRDSVKHGRSRMLGVADQETAVGVIVYSLSSGNYLLDWVYVAQSCRRQGYATALLSHAVEEMMEEGEGDFLIARYDPAEPPEGFEALLESFVFEIRDARIPFYSFALNQVQLPGAGIESREIFGISEILQEWKADFEGRLKGLSSADIIELPIYWRDYSDELSVARVCDKRIEGVLLVKEKEDSVEISMAYACSDKAMTFMLMVFAAFDRIKKKRGGDVTVDIAAVTEFSENLVGKLVPGAEATSVREGIYALR